MRAAERRHEAASELAALTEQVARAAAENADGHPARAARRLRPALGRLEVLSADPAAAQALVRAVLELAKSDFEVRGDATDALDRLAGLAASGAGWPGLEPAVAGLRGLLHLRAGRVVESLRELDAAVASIDHADVIDACCAFLNRGTLHLERGDLARARRDLTECVRRSRGADLPLLAFKATHNLGYLEYLAGRLPLSLERMEQASRDDVGGPRAIALLDRARVLVEAGLVGVADATLAEAQAIFARDRLPHDVAETQLARAECALLRADLPAAATFAATARRRFARRGDEAWVLRATVLELQIEAAALTLRADDGDPLHQAIVPAAVPAVVPAAVPAVVPAAVPPAVPAALPAAVPAARPDTAPDGEQPADPTVARRSWDLLARRCARLESACAESGRTQWSYVARMIRIEAEVAAGRGPTAQARLLELGPVPTGAPLGVRLHGQQLRAELALRAGDRSRAARHVRAGQRDLAMHRARFGSIDLRTASAVHGAALAEMDVRMALAAGRAGAVFDAAERSRAVISGARRVNPPPDPGTAALLAELRQLVQEGRELDRRPAADPDRQRARREALRLRHAIQARSWQQGDDAPVDRPGRAGEVAQALVDRPGTTVVSVIEHRGQLAAVRVTGSRSTLVPLGPGATLREQTRRVHADLPVVANPWVPLELRIAAERSLATSLRQLDVTLSAVVGAPGELVVVTGDWLGALPWSMLASRAGLPTVVAPSARHWLAHLRAAGQRSSLTGAHLSAIAGPGLEHAGLEAQEVARRWPGSAVLTGTDATVTEAARALRSPGVVHLAAHGRHETENPLFSSVRLADGPLFAHELDRVSEAPELVLLSSCEVGRTTVRPGGEALGLTSVLLRIGVGCVVAAIAPLSDALALRVMTTTHDLLRDGWGIAPALAVATRDGGDRGVPVPLVCFGATA